MDEYYLGIRIKIARKQANFSQEELAKALNITLNTISRYEKGHRKPDADVLRRMVEILHCDPSWLLLGPKKEGEGVAAEPQSIYNMPCDPDLELLIRKAQRIYNDGSIQQRALLRGTIDEIFKELAEKKPDVDTKEDAGPRSDRDVA